MDRKIAIGIVLAAVVAFSLTIYFYNRTLGEIAVTSCTDMVNCAHEKIVETQNLIIGILVLVVGVLGISVVYLHYSKKGIGSAAAGAHTAQHHAQTTEKEGDAANVHKHIDESGLEEEARKTLGVLRDKGGSAYQSDVIRETGFSKVKVSRILDRLEQKGIVERKRRGMANLVVIK